MSTTYAGANVFPTTITLPADGEPPLVASVNVPLEGVADRTTWLKARADAADGALVRDLQRPITKDSGGTTLDFSYTRADGSATGFWCPSYNLWIKTGVNVVGKIYIGDNGYFALFDTAATAPPKVTFGCDSALQDTSPGRVCLFDSASYASNPKYILGPISGDYSGTWTTTVLDANTYLTFVRANDCVVTPAQTMIVVGGGDISGAGQFLVWRSINSGATFTRINVANVSSFGDYFTRVIVGKAGRLVAWTDEIAVNQGSTLWYSDNDGATWSSRSAIGFHNIKDGAYLADLDLWAFAADTSIYTTPDPVIGAFTTNAIGTAASALGGFGHYLVYGQSVSFSRPELRLSLNGMVSSHFIARDPTTGQAFRNIAASPLGQLCMTTAGSLVLTGKV